MDVSLYLFLLSQTADIGMTESVKGDKRKFELWLRGRAEVYIILVSIENISFLWHGDLYAGTGRFANFWKLKYVLHKFMFL